MKEIDGQLNEEQLRAVTHIDGPLMVLAGAGSGKTRVLTYRTAWLIDEKGIDPSSIVLLTFTNKAAAEMKQRVEKMGGKARSLGFAGTFHTFCAKLLREFGPSVGVNHNFSIYDSDDTESLMKQVIKDMGLDPKDAKPGMYLSIIGKMKNDLVTIDAAEKSARDYFHQQLVKIWRKYQESLERNNAVDFDDLLVKSVQLLSIGRIRKTVNKRFKWVLVDEYQDTNKAQFELTRMLTGKEGNITAVGDASQAIYSFRGADFRNLQLLQKEYPNLRVVSLPKNYRSTQNILDAAYGVISQNTTHPVIKLDSTGETGGKVVLYEAMDEKDEARYVVNKCRKIIGENEEAAILYRTNSQSRAFEDELMRQDIAYKLVGGLRFYNRREIKDLLAYLRLLINPSDEVCRKRVESLGIRRMQKYEEWREKIVDVESLKPSDALKQIMTETGYVDKYDARDEEDMQRIENINELLAVTSEYDQLEAFLESAALAEAEIKQNRSDAKITLMTIHAAKGLEFDNVFVVGIEEGLLPHSRTLMEKDETEEERRLMYVAMTRAKKNLYLTLAKSRLVYGGRHTAYPSRFLSEIPEQLLMKPGREIMIKASKKKLPTLDESGEKKRVIVQDWEIDLETKSDFDDVDNW